ncbi:MAG TPA: DUF1289 domain-containing protein [Gammaproteobacteria bacterium]|nr:DUF1289 domain-containing protein [Gammaproteobacteria bacterium]
MPERTGAPTHRPAVTSPCIRNCCLDENDICLGCYRSLTEICAWGEANNAVRQKILHNAAQRRQQRSHDQRDQHDQPENT